MVIGLRRKDAVATEVDCSSAAEAVDWILKYYNKMAWSKRLNIEVEKSQDIGGNVIGVLCKTEYRLQHFFLWNYV